MSIGLELLLALVVLALFVGAVRIIRAVRPFIVNGVVGLLTILLAQVLFGIEVAITALALVIIVLGGFPGALLVLLLSVFGIAFVP